MQVFAVRGLPRLSAAWLSGIVAVRTRGDCVVSWALWLLARARAVFSGGGPHRRRRRWRGMGCGEPSVGRVDSVAPTMSRHVAGREVQPYGSWTTPVTSAVVIASAVELTDVRVDGEDVIWSEGRPGEGGRIQLVRRSRDGRTTDLLQEDQNARTAVHEYGGGACWARDGVVWFVAWDDQRLYRLDPKSGAADALVLEPALRRGERYADGDLTPDGEWIACVREHHSPSGRALDVRNELVRLAAHRPSTPEVLVTGPDFVMSPRWSPAGDRLCWVEWDHPNMPWDGSRLRVRELVNGREVLVAGGPDESVSEPCWQADGSLTFISDPTGWWNLYRWSPDDGTIESLVQIAADIGEPQWMLGLSRYALLADGRVVFARSRDGFDGLAVRLVDGTLTDLELPYSLISTVRVAADSAVVVVGGTPTAESSVARVVLDDGAGVESFAPLRPARDLGELGVDPSYVSVPTRSSFRPRAAARRSRSSIHRKTLRVPDRMTSCRRYSSLSTAAPPARPQRSCSSGSSTGPRGGSRSSM